MQNPKKAVYLNPVAGERAVLIKNNAGDWAFVVGRWKGFRKGVPGVAGKSMGDKDFRKLGKLQEW